MLIAGKCHCGNVGFELRWMGDPRAINARACGCSFCVQHGGVWTADARSSLVVLVRDAARVSEYTFGTRTAAFHVCAICGVVPVVTSTIEGRAFGVVNVNTFVGVDPSHIQHGRVDFEGEDAAQRLARRSRSWIPDVERRTSVCAED